MKQQHPPLRDPNILFEEEEHTYEYVLTPEGTGKGAGQEGITLPLVSCSSFYGEFFESFDADKVIYPGGPTIAENSASKVNDEIHSYAAGEKELDELPKTQRLFRETTPEKINELKEKEVPVTPRRVKLIWEAHGERAATHGTLVHEQIEKCIEGVLDPLVDDVEKQAIAGVNAYNLYVNNHGRPQEVYTELIIGDPDVGVAGTIDLLLVYEDGVHLLDWKTNKEIKTEGYRGETADEPISHLPDCSFSKYNLQLSIYAYILSERYGRDVSRLNIVHVPESGGFEIIPVEFLRDEVEELIASGRGR